MEVKALNYEKENNIRFLLNQKLFEYVNQSLEHYHDSQIHPTFAFMKEKGKNAKKKIIIKINFKLSA